MKKFAKVLFSMLLICLLLVTPVATYAQENGDEATDQLPFKLMLPLVLSGDSSVEQVGNTPLLGAAIPNQFIVVFKSDLVTSASVNAIAAEMATQYGGELLYAYDAALQGFAIKFPEVNAAAATSLAQDTRVEYMEPDTIVALTEESAINTTQAGPTWGLDRIDQRNLPLSATYTYAKTGFGVRVYVIDTGIRVTHTDFGGRAFSGYDFVSNDSNADDCNGHGTHVAGTIGSNTYGVAKRVTLYAVRVLNCSGSGTTSGVIAGINWVKQQKQANSSIPAVANMSLGGGASTSLDSAVSSAISAGVTFAIAAGNSTANACNYSPARVANAITVGATTSTDARASYSNYGSCLDIFAPGSSIKSTWYSSNSATATLSGTSMATPHVAGVAALYLQGSSGATPATVATALINNATGNKVTSPGSGSPNRLLFTNY